MSTSLRAPLTRFVGREVELSSASALLRETRLLTLTGPAARARPEHAHGPRLEPGRERRNYLHSLLGLAWIYMFRGDFAAVHEAIAQSRVSAKKAGTDSRSITSLDHTPGWLSAGWNWLPATLPGRAKRWPPSLLSRVRR